MKRTDRAGLKVLSRQECLDRLAGAAIGRVGFHAAALPVVLPVVFAVDGDSVVFATRAGSKLESAIRDAVVAFEADDFEPVEGAGWSVAVTGYATEVVAPDGPARLKGSSLGRWADHADARFFRVSLEIMSGREGQVFAARPPVDVTESHTGVVFLVGDHATPRRPR
ncbi:MAG: pyridoxamine 5'-phosphate oxidase family protein [Acidimicrobiales bacterium]